MKNLFNSKLPILICGETGSGKSRLANEIHLKSSHANEPFVKCNLAGLSDNLFESEIFGHVKGAFTGANSDKLGFCDLVGRGTLFLDEIGELSSMQQKRLLNILDDEEFFSVGSTRAKKFNGRFIFATHRNLEEMVLKGSFREDLFYRIGAETIELKPFRRLEESRKVSKLNDLVLEFSKKYSLENITLSECATELLCNYLWPGNYRELRRTMEYTILKLKNGRMTSRDLPDRMKVKNMQGSSFKRQLEDLERKIIKNELVNRGIGVNKASKSLGISKTTLIAKMRKYGITVHQNIRYELRAA